MASREMFAFIAGPLVLAAIIWLPAWVFLTVLAAVVVGAAVEQLQMARAAGIPCGTRLPPVMVAGVVAAGWIAGAPGLLVAVVSVLLLAPTLQLADPGAPKGGLTGAAVTTLTVLYLGVTTTCLGWLRTLPGDALGWRLVLLFLITIWFGDSGAYYVGKNLGRHRMSPQVSPNKTWEGLAGGVVATFVAAAILKIILRLELGWLEVVSIGAILAVAAPVGDLIESLIKRDTGVKDSSGLIPGHGGLLDRTDSLLFAAPPVLGYLLLAGIIG
jgi:phosphatidate cytidylyltransferase